MSANIIDSLVVLLGLDHSNYKKGQKEVIDGQKKIEESAEKAQKRLDEQSKKAAEALGKVRDAALDIGAALIAAFAGKAVLEHIARADVATTNFAKNTGTTTQEVKALEGAFANLGGSAEDAQGAISGINKIMLDLKNKGSSDAITPLARAGFLDATAFARAKDYTDRLLMLSDALRKMPRTDAQYWLKDAGFSEGSGNALLAGREALLQQIALQTKLNSLSEDDKRAAQERAQASNNLSASTEGLSRKIATEFTPIWTGFQSAITGALTWLQHHMTALVNGVGALGGSFLLLKGYGLELWGLKMGGALGGMARAAGALVGRLGGVLAVMTALWDIYKLGQAFWDVHVFNDREGVKLTPETAARVAAGETGGAPAPGGGSGSGGAGFRNNNPGNIEFKGQPGATRSGRWAVFSSMVEGYAAMDSQLTRYLGRGDNTIAKIVSKYAPAKDGNNVAAYIADLSGKLGKGANDPLDASSMGTLMAAMAAREMGGSKFVNMRDLQAGMVLANTRGTGAGTTVNVDTVTINTPSTDPKAHADAFAGRLGSLRLATQSSTGMM